MGKLSYVYDASELVAAWVAQRIPRCRERGFGNCTAIGIVEDGKPIAGIVYHNWEPEAGIIEISGAAEPGHYWCTRETLRRSYEYPFDQLGVQMIVQRNSLKDERLLRQLATLNFSFIRIPRMLGRDEDGVLCMLTDDAWEASKFNRSVRHPPEAPIAEAAE